MIFSVNELFQIAKNNSPFYKDWYKGVSTFTELADLPVLESASFWNANSIDGNKVLTEPQFNGIVFKSGGTTGNPKFSFFSLAEWELFTAAFGEGMRKGGLQSGEKIADLFYAGDLYASFLFITKSIEKSGSQVVQFPLSGGADFGHIVDTLNSFKISTWAGVPTTIMKLTEYARNNNLQPPSKILFGGESLYPDQIDFIKGVFPQVHIQSIGYASVDGGLLGFVDSSCELQEHRVFSDHTVMEILDEDTLEPIDESGKPGKLFLTNLTRRLMPVIRYPVGDKAMWIDSSAVKNFRKFKILGRSEEGARVGPATIFFEDVSELLNKFHNEIQLKGFQLKLIHYSGKDQLIIRIAAQNPSEKSKKDIQEHIYKNRELIKQLVDDRQIHPLEIELGQMSDLDFNARTGKLKRLVDLRGSSL